MIKKILKSCLLLSFAVVSIQLLSNTNSSEIVCNDLEHLFTLAFASDGESDGGYSCSVTSECYSGSVSCTGQVCSRGSGWVKCDGNKTEC
jgi:hypothetical protein